MVITAEQVADLQPGDVVRLTSTDWSAGSALEGALALTDTGSLLLRTPYQEESYVLRYEEGSALFSEKRTLTVISRAPRSLYVNHPRTKPAPGDVVRSAETQNRNQWMYTSVGVWINLDGGRNTILGLPERLRLLVDGETCNVVSAVPQDGAR